MKTTLKTLAVFAGLTLLAACAAQAGDTTAPTFNCPGYGAGYSQGNGPGWRHAQMMQARMNNANMPCGAAVQGQGFGPGYGQGMRGFGPPTNADGTIDTSKLPSWCPYANQAPKTE